MKRLLVVLIALAALAVTASALAHPLGNFTVNRYSRIEPSGNRLYVLYVLDMAEIPTFQAKPEAEKKGEAAYAAGLARSIARGIEARIGGSRIPLAPVRHVLAFPPGQAGLRTTRLEVLLSSLPLARSAAARLVYRDRNFDGRIGWREIVVKGGSDARLLGSSAPGTSVSHELLSYPKSLLQSPLDVTEATARFETGTGSGSPPTLIPRTVLEQRVGVRAVADGGFASLITRDRLSLGVILVSLGLALFWGAAHALSPGHGKSIVTAYLVGQRGRPRHAVFLGAIVTVTHTIGVFALGLVTLLLSKFIVPDQLYPWLNLFAGLMVVTIGLSVLRARLGPGIGHRLSHLAGRDHRHRHGHGHDHGAHGHSHAPPDSLSLRSLAAVGVSGGLLPCPSALVVLLAAISLHRVAFGLALILAFSLGLALTISGIGLTAILARRVFNRVSFEGSLVRLLPAASALVILVAGVVMTARALPQVT
jgi:nickel/cobalt transporter (NicO) family protein